MTRPDVWSFSPGIKKLCACAAAKKQPAANQEGIFLLDSRTTAELSLQLLASCATLKNKLGEMSGPVLKIGAFNIQHFGKGKLKNPEVMEVLSKIVREYDIIFIQEIRDKTKNTVIPKFLEEINR